jgi:protein O-mannosyl-transferase
MRHSTSVVKDRRQDSQLRLAWQVSLVLLVGTLVYGNGLWGTFIFDDIKAIETNMHIRQLWPPTWLKTPLQSSVSGRPVVSLSLAVNYTVGGLDVRSYHVFNIALHLLSGLVVYGIVRRTLRDEHLRSRYDGVADSLALLCVLIWIVHPLQSESINYIIQRTELLMGLFYLLTLYSAIRARESGRPYGWYGISVLCCALGMASKEVMATAPLMVVLYDMVFRSASVSSVLRRRWGLYVGLIATWVVLAGLNWSSPRSDAVGFSHHVSAWDYALNQCLMLVRYLRLVVWPHPLVLDYGFPQALSVDVVAPYGVVVVGLLVATSVALYVCPAVGFLGAWFFVILGPTSSFVPIISEVGAERRMYLPLLSVVVLVVVGGYRLLETAWRPGGMGSKDTRRHPQARDATARRVGWVVSAAVVMGLSWLTVSRNAEYRSEVSIWRTSVLAWPDNPRAHYALGKALQSEERLEEAGKYYRQALAMQPDYVEAHTNLGTILQDQGRVEDAISHYHAALRASPKHAPAHFNLGNAWRIQGRIDTAIKHYHEALAIRPEWTAVHNNLGNLLSMQGRVDEAVKHYRQAVALEPNYARGHYNLGIALQEQGELSDAMSQYRQAIALKPDYSKAHYMLATVLKKLGRFNEGLKHLRLAEHYDAVPRHSIERQRRHHD